MIECKIIIDIDPDFMLELPERIKKMYEREGYDVGKVTLFDGKIYFEKFPEGYEPEYKFAINDAISQKCWDKCKKKELR